MKRPILWPVWVASALVGLLCYVLVVKVPDIEAMAMVVLVLVTTMYVIITYGIFLEMRRSVEAAYASVVEMQKHRYIGSQPWVFPSLVDDEGKFVDVDSLFLVNVGKGPAIDLKSFISDGDVTSIANEWKSRTGPTDSRRAGPSLDFLKVGQRMPLSGAFEAPISGHAGVIAVEYHDSYGREFLSGRAYTIQEVETRKHEKDVTEFLLVPGNTLYPLERK